MQHRADNVELPKQLVDVLQAPVPFIAGAHRDAIANLPPVRAADGSVVPFVPECVTWIDLHAALSTKD